MAAYEIETMIQDVWPMTHLVPVLYRNRVTEACRRFVDELEGGQDGGGGQGHPPLINPSRKSVTSGSSVTSGTQQQGFNRLDELPDGAMSIIFQLVSIFRFFVEYLAKAGGQAVGGSGLVDGGMVIEDDEADMTTVAGGGDEDHHTSFSAIGDSETNSVMFRSAGEGGALGKAGALYHKHGAPGGSGNGALPGNTKIAKKSPTQRGGKYLTEEQRAVSILEDAADVLHRLLLESNAVQEAQYGLSSSLLGAMNSGVGTAAGAPTSSSYRDNPLIHTKGHVMLRLLRVVLNSEGNAKLWVRWYGCDDFSVEVWKFVDAVEKEVNHLPQHGRREIIEDYVHSELDFNHDGVIDVAEFALGCPSIDVSKVIELRYEEAMRHSKEVARGVGATGAVENCVRCARLEAQLCLERRTTESMKQHLARLKDREQLLKELETAHVRIKDLTAELDRVYNPPPPPPNAHQTNLGSVMGYVEPKLKHSAAFGEDLTYSGGGGGLPAYGPASRGYSIPPAKPAATSGEDFNLTPAEFHPDERVRQQERLKSTMVSRNESNRLQEAIAMLNKQRTTPLTAGINADKKKRDTSIL